MKLIFILFSLLTFSHSVFADWGSVLTNIEKDCVVISSATENAPIDFYESECKSFGRYSLFIKGSDLRYAPKLIFNSLEIELLNPYSFHDLANNDIMWIYSHEINNEGFGSIKWIGLVYALNVASIDDEGTEEGHDKVIYYAVSLNGPKTCIIGRFPNNAEASLAIQNNNSKKCIKE